MGGAAEFTTGRIPQPKHVLQFSTCGTAQARQTIRSFGVCWCVGCQEGPAVVIVSSCFADRCTRYAGSPIVRCSAWTRRGPTPNPLPDLGLSTSQGGAGCRT